MEKELNSTVQIRINKDVKNKMKYLAAKRGYRSLSEYMKYLAMKDIAESEFKSLYNLEE